MASQSKAEDIFTDDFSYQLPNHPANCDPWSRVPSREGDEKKFDFLEQTSERYIASLEARLRRIQGKARDPTSKDLIQGLEKAKDAHMTTLVQSSDQPYLSNYIPDKDNVQNPNILQRKLHPEKIAISADERKHLVDDDGVAKQRDNRAINGPSTLPDPVSEEKTLTAQHEKSPQDLSTSETTGQKEGIPQTLSLEFPEAIQGESSDTSCET